MRDYRPRRHSRRPERAHCTKTVEPRGEHNGRYPGRVYRGVRRSRIHADGQRIVKSTSTTAATPLGFVRSSEIARLGFSPRHDWSYQTFVEGRVTYLHAFTTSTPLVGSLKILGADAAKVAVLTGAIVESIDAVGDVRQRDVAARIDLLLDALLL